MTDKPETSRQGEASEVRPLPAPRPGQPLKEGDDPGALPQPRDGQVVRKADHREPESR
jgi:hypothetical protein